MWRRVDTLRPGAAFDFSPMEAAAVESEARRIGANAHNVKDGLALRFKLEEGFAHSYVEKIWGLYT